MTRRRKYTDEFKRRAVRMSYSSERSVRDVAESLGVDKSMLYQWRKRYTPDGDKSEQAEQKEDIRALQMRIAELEEENDILKKASAYFAKNQR